MADDELRPICSRRNGRAVGGRTENGGVIVKVTTATTEETLGPAPSGNEPTRYARFLRRQAANRIRLARGGETLAPVKAGSCARCEGWGVVTSARIRCPDCGGTGI